MNDNDDGIDIWWCPVGWLDGTYTLSLYHGKEEEQEEYINNCLSISMKMLLLLILYGEGNISTLLLYVMVVDSYVNVNVDYVVSNNNDADVDSSNYDNDDEDAIISEVTDDDNTIYLPSNL